MLVIDRKDQQKVTIFVGDVTFEILIALEKGKAKLLFDAPRVVQIWRTELLQNGERPAQRT
jgi:sRNA-binding carbon storage regulator CsrA